MTARLEYGKVDRQPNHRLRPLLLNLSGGADSVYVAWQLLTRGHRLVLHHCVMRNREGRADFERDAVAGTLEWFRQEKLTKFAYVESGYDHGTLGRLPYDVEVIGFLTGVILRDPSRARVDTVVVSANKSDPSVTNPRSARVMRRQQIAEVVAGRRLRWWVPFHDVTKQQMVAELPEGLRDVMWSCRRPKDGGVCGSCRPCREIAGVAGDRQLQLAASQEGSRERRPTHRTPNRGVRAGS